jgi:Uncharacterized protein conserved in bacteria (DUF2314)
MTASLHAWPFFCLSLVIYGFAPGLVLRLIVRAFHPEDPRRQELLAELHAVPRLERPFWVLEQLEVALSEGLCDRLVWAATGRLVYRWHFRSGVESNRRYPDSFQIPTDEQKRSIMPGDHVRLMFEMNDGWCERMWVDVTAITRRKIVGRLVNSPVGIPRLYAGDEVTFSSGDVIEIHWCGWSADDDAATPCDAA